MEYMLGFLIALVLILIFLLFRKAKPNKKTKPKPKERYDCRGFDHDHIHRNGTKYDDFGFDFYGYNAGGYNSAGYNRSGKNNKGQYDRFYDTKSCEEEGFLNKVYYPIALSNHARERFEERLRITDWQKMDELTLAAYRFGKSKRQIKKTSAYLVEEIEQKHQYGIVLIFKNYIYVFSSENVLITVYKKDKIPL